MSEPSTNVTAIRSPDHLVQEILEINEEIEILEGRRKNIRTMLAAQLEYGAHQIAGVTVSVRQPSRSFDAAMAWTMLNPEQQRICVSPDAKLIKAQLPQVLIDQCMKPTAGDDIVTVK